MKRIKSELLKGVSMNYYENYQKWLNDPRLSQEGKAELESINTNEKEIEYRFGGELEFGTAGMRGIIGYGMNMMNVYTVMRATQGLAEFIKGLGKKEMDRGVVISYDTRRKSYEFLAIHSYQRFYGKIQKVILFEKQLSF